MARQVNIGRFHTLVTRPEAMYFPVKGLTKGDLVRYYRRISEVMVPHLRHRPVVMQRFPEGIDADGFIQRRRPEHLPDWVGGAVLSTKRGGNQTYVVINGEPSLVEVVNLGCIAFHTWLSRVDRPDHPDRIVFDLDPGPSVGFDDLRFAARCIRDVVEGLDLEALVATTGSDGLHVVVPIRRQLGFGAVRSAAQTMAELASRRHPNRLTTGRSAGRVRINVERNAYGRHSVAPYSVRALAGAPVSTPLDWAELGRRDLDPRRYSVSNLFRRLGQRDDPWRDAWQSPPSLKQAIPRLEALGGELES